MKLKAKHTEYLDVELSRREVMEAACKIIYEANNLPEDSYMNSYGEVVVEAFPRGNIKVRLASEEDEEALTLVEKLERYAANE